MMSVKRVFPIIKVLVVVASLSMVLGMLSYMSAIRQANKAQTTTNLLRIAEQAIKVFNQLHGRVPNTLSELQNPEIETDAWGNAINYTVLSGPTNRVMLRAPAGSRTTNDDIIVSFEMPKL